MIKHGKEIPVDQLKHNQKFKIALTEEEQGQTITYHIFSIEVAQLFLDFLRYGMMIQPFEHSCRGKSGYLDWTCCPEHRQLAEVSRQLQLRANKILPNKDDLQILSPAWWQKLGFSFSSFPIIIP